MMRDGECWELPTWALHTSEIVCGSGLWLPTLTVHGNYNRKGASKTSGDGLVTALKAASSEDGGPLSPTWAEWFMGWPMGWTASQPLEMDKFRSWQQQHGVCLEVKMSELEVVNKALEALKREWPEALWVQLSPPHAMPAIIGAGGTPPAGGALALYVREDGTAWGSVVVDDRSYEPREAGGADAVACVRELVSAAIDWRCGL